MFCELGYHYTPLFPRLGIFLGNFDARDVLGPFLSLRDTSLVKVGNVPPQEQIIVTGQRFLANEDFPFTKFRRF